MSNEDISKRGTATPLGNLIVITGGAKSGKSMFAERLARDSGLPVTYLATMPKLPDDAELDLKVALHRQRRPSDWQTIEAELDIHEPLEKLPQGPGICVIDCLSLYVSNIMLKQLQDWTKPISAAALKELENKASDALILLENSVKIRSDWRFVIVTNEVGWSVVPDNNVARVYRDLLGNANQQIARAASDVYLACVGLNIMLKQNGVPKLN